MSIDVSKVNSTGFLAIRFGVPEARNALSSSILSELHQIVENLKQRSDVNTVVFTGKGNIFASGADLREIAALTPVSAGGFAVLGQSLMGNIAALPQMTTAAVNGYCFGGALDLALACDRRIASPDATFAHPGAGLGIITGWGGTQRLPRLIGRGNALEMFFTAEPVSAQRALAIGLVDEIIDDIFDLTNF